MPLVGLTPFLQGVAYGTVQEQNCVNALSRAYSISTVKTLAAIISEAVCQCP